MIVLILMSGALGLLALLVWRVPQWQRSAATITDVKERITVENEILKSLAGILGGAFVLVGLYFTWRTVDVAQEGQITERFNKAIDHLGSEKLEIRLGGIYALARIARDSPKDHWSVMEVLCAYVRENGRKGTPKEPRLRTDIQTILTVLAQRNHRLEAQEQSLDLSAAQLSGASLRNAWLVRARFVDADLERADFSGSVLNEADFSAANLKSAYFRSAQLKRSNLTAANLQYASLRECCLSGANLFGAIMNETSLIGTDLRGAVFATKKQLEHVIADDRTAFPEFPEAQTAHDE